MEHFLTDDRLLVVVFLCNLESDMQFTTFQIINCLVSSFAAKCPKSL